MAEVDDASSPSDVPTGKTGGGRTGTGAGAPNLPAQIGPYRLVAPIGQGGGGIVFRVVHVDTGETAALKTVKIARESQLAGVRREILALRRIRHHGIVRILDGGVYAGNPWYAMELLEGSTLGAYLASSGISSLGPTSVTRSSTPRPGVPRSSDISTSEARPGGGTVELAGPSLAREKNVACGGHLPEFLTLIRRLCEPLAYIHGEGMVHRDLKPTNVFVRSDRTPVLMDFGLAWVLQDEGSRELLAVEAVRAGTLGYMAPEQARGERLDARADLFSLGCIMYEAITGRLPFHAHSADDLASLEAHESPARPSEMADGVPRGLDDLVLQLLSPRPRDRIGHATDVGAALAELGAEGWPFDDPRPRAYLYRPEIAGRGGLLDTAVAHLHDLAEGKGGCLLVSGESGIGKTSFVAELARLAGTQGLRVATGECTAVSATERSGVLSARPFYPLRPLLQQITDLCNAGGEVVLDRILGARAKILVACEPSFRQLPGIDRYPDPPDLPGEAAKRRLVEALTDTLAAFGRDRPLLLVIDDLQWADDLTLAALQSMSASYFEGCKALVVGTFRSEEVGPDLDRLKALPHVANLRLDRLDVASIGLMTAGMLAQREAPPPLTVFLANESSGNPFFVAEYLRAAVDVGLLFRDDRGRWRQDAASRDWTHLGLPRTLHALVTRRLASLPDDVRQVTEVAATIGRQVDVEVLAALALETGAASDDLLFADQMRVLRARQVLEEERPGAAVRFVHDKLREIVYEQLAPERRRRLHGLVGRFLETWYADKGTLERHLGDLAHHFEQAGDDVKALAYLDQAGEAAHRTHSNREAMQLLTRAKAVEEKLGEKKPALDRARRERTLGLNALALGDVQAALAHLLAAAELAGRPWPAARPALVGRVLSAVGREVARRRLPWLVRDRRGLLNGADTPRAAGAARTAGAAGTAGGRADAERERRELLLEAARAYERLTVVFYFATGDFPSVALSALTNIDLAERAGGPSVERALGYATLSSMSSLIPLSRVARFYAERAIAVAVESGDLATESWVLINVTMPYLQTGDWDRARQYSEKARALARQIGFSRRWEEASSQFSTLCFLAGNFDESSRLNDDITRSIERADPQAQVWALVRKAELCLIEGDTDGALEGALEGRRLCERNLGRPEWIFTLGTLALAQARAGDRASARDTAARCAEWIGKGAPIANYNIYSYSALAETYYTLLQTAGDGAEKKALGAAFRRAIKQVKAIARVMPVAAPRALLWKGRQAVLLDGKPERGRRLFQQSLDRARQLKMPYDEAMALTALARVPARAAGAPAAAREQPAGDPAALLEQAAGILDTIGAFHDLAEVRRLRAALADTAGGRTTADPSRHPGTPR